MAGHGSIEKLVLAVGGALRGVVDAVTTEDGFREVATALGWDVEQPPGPLAALAAPAHATIAAVEALGDDPSPTDIDALRVAAVQLVGALRALDPAAFPAELRELGETFFAEALAHSVLDYLFREHRLVLHALRALAIVRFDYVPRTATRAARIRRRILWDNVERLFTDPAAAYREAYGWGTAAFDAPGFLGAIHDLLCSMRWPAGLDVLPAQLMNALRADDGARLPDIGITLRILERPHGTAGVRLVALPKTATQLPALAVLPFASAGLSTVVPVDDHLDLELGGDLDLQGGLGVRLTPEDGLSVVVGLSDPASASAGTGTIYAAVDVHDPAKQPVELLAVAGMVLRATTAVGRAGATVDTLGNNDLFVELELKDASFSFDSGGDGLLAKHVPGGAASGFSIAMGISAKRGLYLRGGNGLATRIPVGVHVGPLTVEAIEASIDVHDGRVELALGTELAFAIGPVAVRADGLGLSAKIGPDTSGNFGVGGVTIAPALPTKLALSITAPGVAGGGEISRDPEHHRYTGALALTIGPYAVAASVLVETQQPQPIGYSFAAALSATFPAVQLGFGFTLSGIGGVVMLHRQPDLDAIRTGLRSGALQHLLFPAPAELPAAVTALETCFTAAAGRYVVGPAARIGWATFARADLAILVELPSPIRVVLLGALEVGMPALEDRVVDLRLDLLGVWDVERSTVAIDASLHDSSIAGYPLAGDMALRAGWGADRHLLLSIGGFHPQFTPPPGFPALRRLSLTAGDNPSLRMEAYLALTSNTAQIGAHVELGYHGGGFQVSAAIGFDALFELSPFHFEVAIAASASISWHGHHLLGVSLDGMLSGPRRWHAKGDATFSVLWWDVSVGFDESWGDDTAPPLPSAPDPAPALVTALQQPDAWGHELSAGERAWVVTTATERVHPHSLLVIRQRAVPLDYDITQLASIPLPGAVKLSITSATVGVSTFVPPPVSEAFAPAQFTQMSPADRLSAPSFEDLHAGVAIGRNARTSGASVESPMDTETIVFDPLAPPDDPPLRGTVEVSLLDHVAVMSARRSRPTPSPSAPKLGPLLFALATRDGMQQTVDTANVAGGATTYNALAAAAKRAGTPLQVVAIAELR